MTDKQKLEKIKGLADAMYNAAFNITTDASHLKKAIYDYHQFVIQELHKEEPVSEDLEEAADKHLVEKGYLLTANNGEHLAEVEAKGLFKAGAQWQKQQLIDKACEWLNNFYSEDRHCYLVKEDIDNFKQAMEEQL